MYKNSHINWQHNVAIGLTLALVAIYALVPANSELFSVPGQSDWMILQNIYGSMWLGLIIIFVGHRSRNLRVDRAPSPIHSFVSIPIFIGGCFWLNYNGWNVTREGAEGTISALFRALWFIVIIGESHSRMTTNRRILLILATCILMFFDQSRTYFLIALLILITGFHRALVIPAISSVIAAALLVAAIRSGENDGFFNAMMFAIGGEGYLGSQGIFQVLSLPEAGINFSEPAVLALLSPVTAPFVQIFKRLGYSTDMFDSSSYLGSYVLSLSAQNYPPMGGFYILSEFIRAGFFGMICMTVYFSIVLYLTKKLFDTRELPIGSYIAILSVKNSPMVYWNLVLTIFLFSYLARYLNKKLYEFSHKNNI